MKRETKETRIHEVSEIFKANHTFYVFDYKNMTVAQSVDLRKTLRKNGSSLKIVKNRLALRALRAEFPAEFKSSFRNPTAVAYTAADPIALARLLKDFAAQNKVLIMKGGLVEGHYFPAAEVRGDRQAGLPPTTLGQGRHLDGLPAHAAFKDLAGPLDQRRQPVEPIKK